MKDFNVRDIRSIVEPRSAEKQKQKTPVEKGKFSETLESAVQQINAATNRSGIQANKVDSTSIKKEVSAATEQLAKMMQAEKDLRHLHQMITQKNQDKS